LRLPLYLTRQSRPRAILWSSLLGGISQPLGAGIAALWFKISSGVGDGSLKPGERVYGGMFAVTAGIMTSIALQLFEESLGITHKKNLCMVFAFIGMGILGDSFALTAGG
jgi:ZIP family zinc transporter